MTEQELAESRSHKPAAGRDLRPELRVVAGSPLPLGVHDCFDGYNFSLFSRHAEQVELLLFENPFDTEPCHILALDPAEHRTGDLWHAIVDGITWGQAYAFRVHGRWAPEHGHRFDPRVPLLDPHGLAVVGAAGWERDRPTSTPDLLPSEEKASTSDAPGTKSLLVDRHFDWEGVRRPHRPWPETVIYETHVRGFTVDASSAVTKPGTFMGLIEKIPYLLELGVTAVELMPVQEFNHRDNPRFNSLTGAPLANYWGYNTVAFCAPKESYGTGTGPGCQVHEFKTMVREFHRAGIEVILDVVFNHTAEGGKDGPTLSFRGLDNSIYYLLDEMGGYVDFTGCGNTFNCNHPVVRDYVIDALRYWVTETHVDGFRFDLASVLGRDKQGRLTPNPPLLERIADDPILRDVKLIAEAWDAGGAFQVGSFAGPRWAEWNCHFRDDVRRFWRGDPGTRGAFASRLCGSADLYQHNGKVPVSSVNFVTCHDGFTLNDVVSYAHKHNEANGEDNRDGPGEEYSANYGVEGETDDPAIQRLRLRQIKNMLATLLIARGVPMLLGGDEFRRTQQGNSNAYCQDNAISWCDWRLLERNGDLFGFVRGMIAVRRRYTMLRSDAFYTDEDVRWFDCNGDIPEWHGPSGAFGMLIFGSPEIAGAAGSSTTVCVLFNVDKEPASFAVPALPDSKAWKCVFDTGKDWPGDICAVGDEQAIGEQTHYRLDAHSMAMLAAL
jgi:isoamylase